MKTKSSFLGIFMLVFAFFTATAFAQDQNERLNTLEETVKKQQQTIDSQQKTVDALKEEIDQQKSQVLHRRRQLGFIAEGERIVQAAPSPTLISHSCSTPLPMDQISAIWNCKTREFPALPRTVWNGEMDSTLIRQNFSFFPG
jgi:cell division protein FtsB